MDLKDLSPEQRDKIVPGMSAEELFKLAKQEGVELSAEELDEISGGGKEWTDIVVCFRCSTSYDRMKMKKCPKCGCERYNPV